MIPDGHETERDALAAHLAGRDVRCPRCRYLLSGLRSRSCPECGEALRLRLDFEKPEHRPLIVGTVALAAAAGFALTMLLVYAWLEPVIDPIHWLLIFECAASVALLLGWLWAWRRVRKRSRRTRWLLAALCWVVPALCGLLFLIELRDALSI
ncbi:MAG: hypothetical protein ACYTG1_01055 [Planctomycetota bacterium]|jgi:hypothetical protein